MPEATDEELGIPEGLDPNIRAELRRSRELARDLETANAATQSAQREAAFARAGIPDTPLHAQLAKGYEGENDPAAVKAYFEGLGVDLGSEESGTGNASEQEIADQKAIAAVGGTGEQSGDIRFEDAIKSTKNVDELMALIASAPEGATTRAIDGVPRRIGSPVVE